MLEMVQGHASANLKEELSINQLYLAYLVYSNIRVVLRVYIIYGGSKLRSKNGLIVVLSYLKVFLMVILEIILQGMTWLLPERFSESEIGPEAGFVKLW